ncbi:DUF4835 family protein [candidate division KSB1 bacterium]|nr:DUF4835 family protein [candidate division KSB1 bacterium]MBL7092871.1 DUF4835 family protein [candidate division KSB1 bacterium]
MKLKYNSSLLYSLIFILLINYFPIFKYGVNNLYAQKVRVTVELQLDALPDEKREKLINFKQVLEDYFNNFQWTQDEFQGELPIGLKMMLQDISVNYEDRYKTQFIISSSDIQYADKRCRMAYQKGEIPMHSENNWDSLTSLLDFFTNIIIAEEMDKFGNLLGTPYYEKAKVIAEQAKFGMGHFIDGWDLRVEMIDYLLAEKYKKFREMKDFYFYGLYFANEDPTKAKKYIKEAVSMLEKIKNEEDPKYTRVEKFINAHYMEIVDLFKKSNDRDVYEKLMNLDPDREEIYQDILE